MAQKTILVIDDEADFIDAIKMRFDAYGYNVIGALDGREGVEKVRRESPELILLDVVMPKSNGFEVLSQLKADPKTSHIPIIMITAQSDIGYAVDAGKLGVSEYILKPVSMDALLELIKKYVP